MCCAFTAAAASGRSRSSPSMRYACTGKDVAQRLLDDTCQVRTGRHEEDGCWPSFE
jgi:hypothetical protein